MRRTAVAALAVTGLAVLSALVVRALPEGTLEPVVRAEARSALPADADAKALLSVTPAPRVADGAVSPPHRRWPGSCIRSAAIVHRWCSR
jgi:hypothetical protein